MLISPLCHLQPPSAASQRGPNRSRAIDLDIDFDGTIAWNGTAIASLQQLDSFFRTEAQKEPQPEIRLRPDRRAKYDIVARVLASAQRNRMKKMGFVNTAEFND